MPRLLPNAKEDVVTPKCLKYAVTTDTHVTATFLIHLLLVADGKIINDAARRNFAERKRSPATITFLRRLRISAVGTVIYIVRDGWTIF